MTADQLRRSTDLLWGLRERPARGPKPGLTLDRIVAAAVQVADTHGLDALSMRHVATELGVGTMSLYRYVPGKAELLDLLLDRISAPDEKCRGLVDLPWREALTGMAWWERELYLAHPWLLQVNWTRPVFGPNILAGVELMLTALGGLGLTDQERVMTMMTIESYVVGMVRQEILYASAAEETGVSDEEFWRLQGPALERAMTTGDYPTMAGLAVDSFMAGWAETFEFGLQRLLEGLAVLVAVRGDTIEEDRDGDRARHDGQPGSNCR